MKELYDAISSRFKAPVFGYFLLAFLFCNWKSIFYLFASNKDVLERFQYFEINSNSKTLFFTPLIIGIVGAIIYPWVNLLFLWLTKLPHEYRQVLQLVSKSKILIKEKQLEEARSQFLTSRELDLIGRAKRDEKIQSITDDKLRLELQKEIDDLRQEIDDNSKFNSNRNVQVSEVSSKDLYLELAKLYEKQGKIDMAQDLIKEALNRYP